VLHRIGQYRALSRADRQSLRRAFIWLVIADMVLRAKRFQRLGQWLEAPAEGHVDAQALRRAEAYAHWLDVAARHHVVRARCLHRSLALQHWLRREGLPSRLQIGVRRDGRVLRAHAWVELGGHSVNDSPAAVDVFTPLARPAASLAHAAGAGVSKLAPATRVSVLQGYERKINV
jgi:hypothetical protein